MTDISILLIPGAIIGLIILLGWIAGQYLDRPNNPTRADRIDYQDSYGFRPECHDPVRLDCAGCLRVLVYWDVLDAEEARQLR